MSKSNLETAVAQAAAVFAAQIIDAVRGATLQELMALQGEGVKKHRGRKPGSKNKPVAAAPVANKRGPKAGKKTKPVPKTAKAEAKPKAKKRVMKNYPKCAYPKCAKNRFPKGEGFCGEHWRSFKAGKIGAAATYKK